MQRRYGEEAVLNDDTNSHHLTIPGSKEQNRQKNTEKMGRDRFVTQSLDSVEQAVVMRDHTRR